MKCCFSFQIYKKFWPKTDLELGRNLALCSYFCREVIDEAQSILEKLGEKRALAHVLYTKATANQYNDDISK